MWNMIYKTNVGLGKLGAIYYRWTAFHKNPNVWHFSIHTEKPFMDLNGYRYAITKANLSIK